MSRRKLLALQYPLASSFSASDLSQFRTLVVWLEETKIRHLAVADRAPLRECSSPNWPTAFAQYLEQLECPHQFPAQPNAQQQSLVLDWLLTRAISLEYHDNASAFNEVSKADCLERSSGRPQLDTLSPAFRQALEELATVLQLPTNLETQTLLKGICDIIERRFSPQALPSASSSHSSSSSSSSSNSPTSSAASVQMGIDSLGFSTGDPLVDQAASLLRLMYIADVRDLQTEVNHLLSYLQQHTANPKTIRCNILLTSHDPWVTTIRLACNNFERSWKGFSVQIMLNWLFSIKNRAVAWFSESLRFVTLGSLLAIMLGDAMVCDLLRKRRWLHLLLQPWQTARDFWSTLRYRAPAATIEAHVQSQRYGLETHRVETKDGYILGLHRLLPRQPRSGPPRGIVFCQHGLLNTSLQFVLNGEGKALAFLLVDAGYDVFLGNSRGNCHSRAHVEYNHDEWQGPFWKWTVDDLSLDVQANVDFILKLTGASQLTYIGHSQGCTQALSAFSTMPELRAKFQLLICLSPGAFVRPLTFTHWLRGMSNLYRHHPVWYDRLLGQGAFARPMELRQIVPDGIWTHAGMLMFWHLFRWSTRLWDKEWEPVYFQEVPSICSVNNIKQWFQHSVSGRFCRFDFGALNMKHYGCANPPDYPLHDLQVPTAVIYGARDELLDFDRLIAALPHLVHVQKIPNYFHMDPLCAADAHEVVVPHILRLLQQAAAGSLPRVHTNSSLQISPSGVAHAEPSGPANAQVGSMIHQ